MRHLLSKLQSSLSAPIQILVDNLNLIKGNFLHAACSPSESAVIYQTIIEQECSFPQATEDLHMGIAVFKRIAVRAAFRSHSPYDNLDAIFPKDSVPDVFPDLDTALKFIPRFDFRGRIGDVADLDEKEIQYCPKVA